MRVPEYVRGPAKNRDRLTRKGVRKQDGVVLFQSDVQIHSRDGHVHVSRRIANLGQRPATGQRVRDKRGAAVVVRE
jgi:hypothetical protein